MANFEIRCMRCGTEIRMEEQVLLKREGLSCPGCGQKPNDDEWQALRHVASSLIRLQMSAQQGRWGVTLTTTE